MDLKQYLTTSMQQHLDAARAIADEADKDNRGLSEVERKEAEEHLAQAAEFKTKIAEEDDKARLRGLVDGWDKLVAGGPDDNPARIEGAGEVRGKTLGDVFVNSPVFQMLQAKYKENGGLPEKTIMPPVVVPDWRSKIRTKAAGDPVLETDSTDIFGTGGAGGALTTFVGPNWPLQPRLTIADLIPSIPVTVGNSATWPVIETRTAISGTAVTEGAAKPGGEYVFAVESKALETRAGWIKISTQYIEDAPAMVAYINQDLPYQVRFNEEVYLMAGLYSGAGLSTDGTGIVTTPNGWDAIAEAVAVIAENNGTADGLVISPMDWAALVVTKASTAGTYLSGGPFTATSNPWNLRVVVTSAATDGLPLVGDFSRAARVFRRGGLTMTSTNSDQDDFIKNLVTIRAELRCVLGVSYTNLLSVAAIGTS